MSLSGYNELSAHAVYIYHLLSIFFLPFRSPFTVMAAYAISWALLFLALGFYFEKIIERRRAWLSAIIVLLSAYSIQIYTSWHYETIGITVFFAMLSFFAKDRNVLGILFLVIGLAVKEDFWLYSALSLVAQFGVLKRRIILIGFSISFCYFVLILKWLHPHFYPVDPNLIVFNRSWNYGTGGLSGLALHLVAHPLFSLQTLFSSQNWDVAFSLFLIPLFAGWRSILIAPIAILWASAQDQGRSHYYWYYSYGLFLIMSVVFPFGLQRLAHFFSTQLPKKKKISSTLVLSVLLAIQLIRLQPEFDFIGQWLNPGARESANLFRVFNVSPALKKHSEVLNEAMYLLSANDLSVMSDCPVSGYVPWRNDHARVSLRAADFQSNRYQPVYIVFDLAMADPDFSSRKEILELALKSGKYQVYFEKEGFFLLKKI